MEWQPIETAPKDGQSILMLFRYNALWVRWCEPDDGEPGWYGWNPPFGISSLNVNMARGWMPSPQPPKED